MALHFQEHRGADRTAQGDGARLQRTGASGRPESSVRD